MCELCWEPHIRPVCEVAQSPVVARSVPSNQRLEVGKDLTAVLRRQEAARLRELRDLERLPCSVCGNWIEPDSSDTTTVSLALAGERITAEFAHAECSPSRADLAALVIVAQAEPLGIIYAQAVHPESGPVLLWERKLDVRVRGLDGEYESLYLDEDWWDGFHPALADEPVRLLAGWLLEADDDDLVLRHGAEPLERFHGAIERSPSGWLESLRESGFCLLIVGAGLGLDRPGASQIQRAIREHRALMGLAEFDL